MYLMIAWSFDDGDGGAIAGDDLMMTWGHDCLMCLMMEHMHLMMALGPCWGWHDDDDDSLLTWYIHIGDCLMSFGHGDDMMMSCLGDMIQWRLLDEFWPSWHDALACDEVPYSLTLTYPCTSPIYSCNLLQDPHTPILNPNTPSYTLPCSLHYPITLPIS